MMISDTPGMPNNPEPCSRSSIVPAKAEPRKIPGKAAPQIMRAARSVRRAKGEVSHPGRGFLRVSVVIGAPAWILFLFNILLNFEKIQ